MSPRCARLIGIASALDAMTTWLAWLLGQVAVVSTLVLALVVTYGVGMRFLLNSPRTWTDEVASYSLLWMVFLGLGYTLSSGAHIRVDFFTRLLSHRSRYWLEVVTWLIGCTFALLLFMGCLSAVENFWRRDTHSTAGLEIALFWPALAMLLGAGLFGLIMLTRLLHVCVTGQVPHSQSEREPT
jgi:TRAP-type C4-dicarboxylate transport system permease small subunit